MIMFQQQLKQKWLITLKQSVYERKSINNLQIFTPAPWHLYFNSRFEWGNLDQVYKISDYEFSLYLKIDSNNDNQQTQWFYFSVMNIGRPNNFKNKDGEIPNRVTFTIKNLIKGNFWNFQWINLDNSLFNQGMQPCVFSAK